MYSECLRKKDFISFSCKTQNMKEFICNCFFGMPAIHSISANITGPGSGFLKKWTYTNVSKPVSKTSIEEVTISPSSPENIEECINYCKQKNKNSYIICSSLKSTEKVNCQCENSNFDHSFTFFVFNKTDVWSDNNDIILETTNLANSEFEITQLHNSTYSSMKSHSHIIISIPCLILLVALLFFYHQIL